MVQGVSTTRHCHTGLLATLGILYDLPTFGRWAAGGKYVFSTSRRSISHLLSGVVSDLAA